MHHYPYSVLVINLRFLFVHLSSHVVMHQKRLLLAVLVLDIGPFGLGNFVGVWGFVKE